MYIYYLRKRLEALDRKEGPLLGERSPKKAHYWGKAISEQKLYILIRKIIRSPIHLFSKPMYVLYHVTTIPYGLLVGGISDVLEVVGTRLELGNATQGYGFYVSYGYYI